MEKAKKILVVDDSALMRKMFRDELENGGYEIVESGSGDDALEKVAEEPPPDLISLDVEMPGMDGFEVCRKLYSQEYALFFPDQKENKVPVVFITANDNLEERKKGFQLGATDFLSKPFEKGSLLKVADKILKPGASLKGLTALVIDGNKTSRLVLTSILERSGVKVIEAEDGTQGFETMRNIKDSIDLLITDLEIAGMRGDELCKKVRNELNLMDFPIILLLSVSDHAELLNIFNAGGTDYLIKPFANEELIARMTVHLERARLTKKLKDAIFSLNQEVIGHQEAKEEILRLNSQLSQHVLDRSAKLAHAEKELIQKEHTSELANVASGTLHNVKNILSSIKTSSDLVTKIISGSCKKSLTKANDILRENMDNIEKFICDDPKGKKLMTYYIHLEKMYEDETGILMKHLRRLQDKVDSIDKIITAQQTYGGQEGESEAVDVAKIIEDALTMQAGTMASHSVNVTKEFQKVPQINVCKGKFLHILINLIKNARDAMLWTYAKDRNLTISTDTDDSSVFIKIKDSGQGIPKEDIQKIFTYGYTTKEDGHGYGLHSCASYIKEMNGEIDVQSEGQGKGSTFSMKFPIPQKF